MNWLVCICFTSFSSSWLHCGLGVCGNGSIGCTNNNYASREKCKKCGQPKEVAAMPAIAMPGASLPTYSPYFARAPGAPEQRMNVGLAGNGAPLSSHWTVGGVDKFGIQSAPTWPAAGVQTSELPYANSGNQPLSVPKGWRNGDWICNCGFHNYSSRSQCKNCNASIPPALGTKRLASEEFAHEWDNKRLNLGHTNGQQQPYIGFDQMVGTMGELKPGVYAPYASGVAPNWQAPITFPPQATTPTLLGKGAKQWRNGDWMCTKCNNHNYASRAQCNRCKTQREILTQPLNAA